MADGRGEGERAVDEGTGEQADRLEDRARRMDSRSSELEGDIAEAREDWRSKQTGSGAPGAQTEEGGSDLVDESEEPADFDLSGKQEAEDSGEEESDDAEAAPDEEDDDEET